MQADIDEKLNGVIDKIAKEFQPEKIILFGSYAWGRPTENSDVDLFIVKDTDNTRETSRKISRAIFPRPFPLDVIVYTPEQVEKRKAINDFFISDILNKGKVIYGK